MILDGKTLSRKILDDLAEQTRHLRAQGYPAPGLGIITVGCDPAGRVYVKSKLKKAGAAGFATFHRHIEQREEALLRAIDEFNRNPAIHGYIVQLPLPDHIDSRAVIAAIDPGKDADGFHPLNLGNIMQENALIYPATPAGILRILQAYEINPEGKHVVIAGRSQIVGKPLAMMLLQKKPDGNATVTVIHSRTPQPYHHTRRADIFISAIGKPKIWKKEHFKPGVIVIDVGINASPDGNLCGDVDFEDVSQVASAITPVPGGVGPMTVAMLLENTLRLYQNQLRVED